MTQKNVIYVVADSLRADALGDFGDMGETPFLDSLLKDNVAFTDAVATSSHTKDSFPALFSSMLPTVQGHHHIGDAGPTLAGEFRRHGYDTLGVHSAPFMAVREFNYHRGFDVFVDEYDRENSPTRPSRTKSWIQRAARYLPNRLLVALERQYMRRLTKEANEVYASAPAEDVTPRAIDLFDSGTAPRFLFIHYLDTHVPYVPPQEFVDSDIFEQRMAHVNRKLLRNYDDRIGDPSSITETEVAQLEELYAGAVRYVDHNIERLVTTLQGRGQWEDTVLVFTGDHGDEFREHGGFGHGQKLYEEVIRVPLVIAGPSVPNRTIDTQFSLLDLPPTVLDLVDLDAPAEFLGISFEPAIAGTERVSREYAFSETMLKQLGIDRGRLVSCRSDDGKKLLYTGDEDLSSMAEWEYYDLEADPGEEDNLFDQEADDDRLANLQDCIERYCDGGQVTDDFVTDETIQRRLEHLGYR